MISRSSDHMIEKKQQETYMEVELKLELKKAVAKNIKQTGLVHKQVTTLV